MIIFLNGLIDVALFAGKNYVSKIINAILSNFNTLVACNKELRVLLRLAFQNYKTAKSTIVRSLKQEKNTILFSLFLDVWMRKICFKFLGTRE